VTASAVTIRRARRDDVLAINRIHRAAWSLAYRGIVPDAAIDAVTAMSEAAWESALADERPGVFVAERDDTVLGWVRMQGRMIKSLHVDPGEHGGGIGTALLDHAAAVIGDGAYLLCLTGNPRARGFYARRGWRDDGCEPERIGGVDYPAIRFLAPPIQP
jgi:GNAT superfamily N-acetyltransferase